MAWGIYLMKLIVLGIGFGVLVAFPYILPSIKKFFNKLADKIHSEKIGLRVKDAIRKLSIVIENLIAAESRLYRKELLEIIKDGKIENEEIQELAKKIAAEALKIIAPELKTLQSYFAGEMLLDFVIKMTTSYIVTFAEERLKARVGL